jgi:hypothetical protein
MICSQHIHSDEFEDERRERRKSGIRLDDMTMDTPTTAGSYNQYAMQQYHQDEQKGYHIDGPQNRYDSYDMYRHNNASYGYNNTNANAHANANGGGYNQYHY